MPVRMMALCGVLAGVSALVWQVSGSDREVVCVRDAVRIGRVNCTETETGPLVTDGKRVTEHPGTSGLALRVAQLRSAKGTSTMWSLVVVPAGTAPGHELKRFDVSLVVASGFTEAWADRQRVRMESLERAPAGTAVVFRDGWRGPLMRWSTRLVGLSFLGVGGWELRRRARASGSRAPLLWAAGVVGGLLGLGLVGLLLG